MSRSCPTPLAPEDEFVVGCLEAALSGVQRVDLLTLDSDGRTALRQEDIPFAAESGGVGFAPGIEMIRAVPASTLHLRLLAADDQSEHVLGDYALNHTPHRAQDSE